MSVNGVPSSRDRDSVAFGVDGRELRLETTRLPYLEGRLVWDDDETPVHGSLWLILADRDTGSEVMSYTWSREDGSFEIGLPVTERALLSPPAARPDSLLHRYVRFGTDSWIADPWCPAATASVCGSPGTCRGE